MLLTPQADPKIRKIRHLIRHVVEKTDGLLYTFIIMIFDLIRCSDRRIFREYSPPGPVFSVILNLKN